MVKEDLKLAMTSCACPEQYDVLEGHEHDGHVIGYIRFRWGALSCYPATDDDVIWDEQVYSWSCDDGWAGTIPEGNREELISACKESLCEYWNKKKV